MVGWVGDRVLQLLLLGCSERGGVGPATEVHSLNTPPSKEPHPRTTLPLSSALHVQATVAEVLAAMIPCSRLYGYLGCTLAAATRTLGRHAYSEWLDTYSGAEYLVRALLGCVDAPLGACVEVEGLGVRGVCGGICGCWLQR